MKKVKILTVLIGSFCLAAFSHAESSQDCLLEGKVKNSRIKGHQNIVRIDFERPKPASEGANCHISKDFSFKQPKGHRLENLPAGATVRYRFQSSEQGEQWTLVETAF